MPTALRGHAGTPRITEDMLTQSCEHGTQRFKRLVTFTLHYVKRLPTIAGVRMIPPPTRRHIYTHLLLAGLYLSAGITVLFLRRLPNHRFAFSLVAILVGISWVGDCMRWAHLRRWAWRQALGLTKFPLVELWLMATAGTQMILPVSAYSLGVILTGFPAAFVWSLWRLHARRKHLRTLAGHAVCEECGYIVDELDSRRCPECGTRLRPKGVAAPFDAAFDVKIR